MESTPLLDWERKNVWEYSDDDANHEDFEEEKTP